MLALALTVEEARELDGAARRDCNGYPVYASLGDAVRHKVMVWAVGGRAGFDSPEHDALELACPASGCACPVWPVDSKREGQQWRLCAAAGAPCWSVGRPVEVEPRRAPAKPAPAWAGGRGAVVLTMPLTRAEVDELEGLARDETCYPDHANLADVVRHAALSRALLDRAFDRELEGESVGAAFDAYMDLSEEERAGAPDPIPEFSALEGALMNACPASGCACPVESVRDGQIWRECAGEGGPCWSVGRPSADS